MAIVRMFVLLEFVHMFFLQIYFLSDVFTSLDDEDLELMDTDDDSQHPKIDFQFTISIAINYYYKLHV